MNHEFSEKEWVEQLRLGNEEALKFIYKKYAAVVLDYTFRIVGDRHDAEDIKQDVFAKLWKNRFKAHDGIVKWLHLTSRNACVDFLRRRKRFFKRHSLWLRDQEAIGEGVDGLEAEFHFMTILREKSKGLPPACKEVFDLRIDKGLKTSEIAQILGIAEQTVRNHLAKAAKFLHKETKAGLFLILSIIDRFF